MSSRPSTPLGQRSSVMLASSSSLFICSGFAKRYALGGCPSLPFEGLSANEREAHDSDSLSPLRFYPRVCFSLHVTVAAGFSRSDWEPSFKVHQRTSEIRLKVAQASPPVGFAFTMPLSDHGCYSRGRTTRPSRVLTCTHPKCVRNSLHALQTTPQILRGNRFRPGPD